jgi:hypothetical protein
MPVGTGKEAFVIANSAAAGELYPNVTGTTEIVSAPVKFLTLMLLVFVVVVSPLMVTL